MAVCTEPTASGTASGGPTDRAGVPVYEAVRCPGPKGCVRGSKVTCDGMLARPGSGCVGTDVVCAEGGDAALRCEDGHFAPWLLCRGAKKCVGAGKNLACDASVARAGERCMRGGLFACSDNGKEMLRCDAPKATALNGAAATGGGPNTRGASATGGAPNVTGAQPALTAPDLDWEPYRQCRGTTGCRFDLATSEALCDMTMAEVGDPCTTPGLVACAISTTSELVCRGGAYTLSRNCPKGCRAEKVPGAKPGTTTSRIECQ